MLLLINLQWLVLITLHILIINLQRRLFHDVAHTVPTDILETAVSQHFFP